MASSHFTPCHELLIFHSKPHDLLWRPVDLCVGVRPCILTELPSQSWKTRPKPLAISCKCACSPCGVPTVSQILTPVTPFAPSFLWLLSGDTFKFQPEYSGILPPPEQVLQKLQRLACPSCFIHKLSLNLRLSDRHRVTLCAAEAPRFPIPSCSKARWPIRLRSLIRLLLISD